MKLHLGCGRNVLAGWVNLDVFPGAGVDVVADLDHCAHAPLPFETGTVDEFLGSHVLEHIRNPLPLMQELHRIARPQAKAVFRLPYGSSDDAFEDPTHVRQYFLHSFGYFSQPFYWRADYGYRGDWQPEVVTLQLSRRRHQGQAPAQIMEEVKHLRNVVLEVTAVLVAVKPIRPPQRELQKPPRIEFTLVDA
jgi:SAM-dependent methyltransferase